MSEKPEINDAPAGVLTPMKNRAPGDHPYVKIVRDYLLGGDIIPSKIEHETEGQIQWQFQIENRISVFVRLYKDADGEEFIHLETAIARIDPSTEFPLLRYLAEINESLHHPLRLAVSDGTFVIVQFRCYCGGVTPEHFKLRLETLIPFSEDIQETLCRQFGVRTPFGTKELLKK
ncbi:hypothetical protein WDW37_19425 [Bdellovibrionota bacterium FG-1]